MSYKNQKMLHISSDQQQQHSTNNNPQIQSKNSKRLKLGNYKAQKQQIQRNMFSVQESDYIILPEKQHQKQSSIKMITEQYFDIQNHTINNKSNATISQFSDPSILNEMNINKLSQNYETSQKLSPQKRKQTSAAKSKMLMANFDDQQEQQAQKQKAQQNKQENQRNNNYQSQGQQVVEAIFQKKQQQNDKNQQKTQKIIKQFEWTIQEDKWHFAYHRMKQDQRLQLLIQRQQSGMNYFLPQFDMIYPNQTRHVMSCKKQLGAKFQYNISLDSLSFTQKSHSLIGKVVCNFANSLFHTIDTLKNGIICTTKFKQQNDGIRGAPLAYQIYLLNQNSSYSQLVGANKQCTIGLDQLSLIPINKKHISHFRNKKPQLNNKTGAYMLNFNGRINKGSVKNFIIQDAKSGRQILMFGRGSSQDKFNLYISAPLNPLCAFGIIIPQFSSRIFVM